MERRRLAGMKPASLSHHRKIKKFKKFLKNEKEPQGQQLANLVFEDLAQKTRNRVIVVRKFYRGSLLQRMGWHAESRFGLLVSPIAWRLGVLAVGSSLLNRQDAKDAKIGFMVHESHVFMSGRVNGNHNRDGCATF